MKTKKFDSILSSLLLDISGITTKNRNCTDFESSKES